MLSPPLLRPKSRSLERSPVSPVKITGGQKINFGDYFWKEFLKFTERFSGAYLSFTKPVKPISVHELQEWHRFIPSEDFCALQREIERGGRRLLLRGWTNERIESEREASWFALPALSFKIIGYWHIKKIVKIVVALYPVIQCASQVVAKEFL